MLISCLRQRIALSVLLLSAFAASSKADDFAYVGYGGGNFGTIDLSTGSVTLLGGLGQTPAGLGVFSGTLYAESYNTTGTLYTVNTSNGALTAIGNSGVDYLGGFGSTLTGLYGVGYASGGSTLDLFSINPSNGSATDLGSTGLTLGSWRDISTNSSTLYFGNGPNLYSLDLTNGSATLIGPYGGSAQMGSLVTIGSTLYGADDVSNVIDTINSATGAATGGASSGGSVWGLAPDPLPTQSPSPVPEPSSLLLLGTGVMTLLGAARRRVRGQRG
jgi:PEP-CTERM motif-containing protein